MITTDDRHVLSLLPPACARAVAQLTPLRFAVRRCQALHIGPTCGDTMVVLSQACLLLPYTATSRVRHDRVKFF